mmetsp:Transcript_24578/g.36070  ORF Transcript_24578/g.36070 Transcript_24578/m.36070 type:complete len:99 (+) Transcript_24578:96-392(+)
MSEVEETIRRLKSHRGVEGILIVNSEGQILKSTLTAEESAEHAALLSQLASKARSIVRTLDASNDLSFLRIRSKKNEILVAPDKDFLLIVIQNPHAEK